MSPITPWFEPRDRLIVSADFLPNGISIISSQVELFKQIEGLCHELRDTGVIIKLNSALRACGLGLVEVVHSYGLRVFADLKLYDIPHTLTSDGELLAVVRPEFVTVACAAGLDSIMALKRRLPEETKLLGVTVLSHMNKHSVGQIYKENTVAAAADRLAYQARQADIGLVCAPAEAIQLRTRYGFRYDIVSANIRPAWAKVHDDDQNCERSMSIAQAIQSGVTRVVLGRPILGYPNRLEAVELALEELDRCTH